MKMIKNMALNVNKYLMLFWAPRTVCPIFGAFQDLQGYFMGSDYVSHFTIKDTTPPPLPPAGSITGSFPDADGYITVTATQGSVEAGCTVLLINDTSGELVAVTPN